MELDYQEKIELIDDLRHALGGNFDGSRKNIIVPECPFCGKKGGKFGIYIGKETRNKKPFMWNCFSCGRSGKHLKPLLWEIGRMDLMPTVTTNLETKIGLDDEFLIGDVFDTEIDEELVEVKMPRSYKRLFFHPYLNQRGFTYADFNYFEVGETAPSDIKFRNYILFPVIEDGKNVGYVARHTFSKQRIEKHNEISRNKILRYKNSTEEDGNDFQYLVYNIDSVIEGVTRTVILVEGIFDCIALTRKLKLYDKHDIAVCATFGKQVSESKMVKLQNKGVQNIVLGYDGDARQFTADSANSLDDYFNVIVADINNREKDWDDLSQNEIYEVFTNNLKTPIEYNLNKILI